MSKYVIDGATLSAIADAVREKGGTTEKILVSDIASAIDAIQTGGGEGLTAEDLAFKGHLPSYTLANTLGTAIVEKYGDLITFTDITQADYLFNKNTADLSNLEIKGKNLALGQLLNGCTSAHLPRLTGTVGAKSINQYAQYIFTNLTGVTEIPSYVYEGLDWSSADSVGMLYAFSNCYRLRTAPMDLIHMIQPASGNYAGYYGVFSYNALLDELLGYQVNTSVTATSNMMSGFCSYCRRLANLTFKTNEDGTPITVQWKGQILDLSSYIGHTANAYDITQYGIATDKQVKDDATYAALKDDPDWFTTNVKYSRYNHDSAVNTINSLPDTSAYLATAGGTNTIKFKGQSGELTDGGAINTLTAEEIAVATAKGWTVTLA